MEPNPYASPDSNKVDEAQNPKRPSVFGNRLLFVLTAFLSAMGAFYISLAINVFGAPYMHEHISLGFFLRWLDWALPFAIICTLIVTAASFLINQIERKHFIALIIPFVIELAFTFRFFVAFFGI